MEDKQVEEYVAPITEPINSDPDEEQMAMLMAQDEHDAEDVAPIEEV